MNRHRLVALLLIALSGCASPSEVTESTPVTLVVMNLVRDRSTVLVSGDVDPDSLRYGEAKRLIDRRGTGFGPAPRGIIVTTSAGISIEGISFNRVGQSVLLFGSSSQPAFAFAGDTAGPRADVANIRLALLAPDAPLVKGFVLPADVSLAVAQPWISTQSPYQAPSITTFFRGPPQAYRVYFTRYAPASAEPLLAATDAFTVAAGEVVTVMLDRQGADYVAAAIREPR